MTQSRIQAVLQLQPFDADAYESIDLNRLIVYVISRLDEAAIPVTFESVTVAAFRLFPEKFQLVGFEQFPDAARVNRALLQLRPKYRNWAMGTVKRGFVLSESGSRVLDEVRAALSTKSGQSFAGQRPVDPGRTRDLATELGGLESSPLFAAFRDTGKVAAGAERQVYDALEAFPYTPRRALRGRLRRLESVASEVGRSDLVAFIREMHRTYVAVFSEEK